MSYNPALSGSIPETIGKLHNLEMQYVPVQNLECAETEKK